MNIVNLTLVNLKINKKQIIGWGVAIFSIMFLYMILFPSVKDMAQIKMESMPKEIMQFMGVNSFEDMSNYLEYFAMIYNLLLIAISVFAAIFGANIVANEEKNKTLEFTYALKVSRLEIYISKVIATFLGVIFVIIAAAVATIICGLISGGETFDLAKVIMMIKGAGQIPFVYMAIGLMFSAITTKFGGASISSMIVILTYVIGFLSTMVSEGLRWIEWISPFEMLKPNKVTELNADVMLAMSIYAVFMIVCIVVGGFSYNKRDFNL